MQQQETEFFSSGSTLLNCALGGGWARRRVFNIVGDKSTGKTLIAIESFANFVQSVPKPRMRYGEAEAALDEIFASNLGLPMEVERPEKRLDTVEEFHQDLKVFQNSLKEGESGLYILDSLDSLSSDAEKEDKDAYGAGKAKEMSAFFRDIVRENELLDCSLGIISQIRDRLNVQFGERYTRSGGHALDFYSSQILWLAETGKIEKTVFNLKRAIGVNIEAKVKKSKVGLPLRKVEFPVIFNYGIDDEKSMINFLSDIGVLSAKKKKAKVKKGGKEVKEEAEEEEEDDTADPKDNRPKARDIIARVEKGREDRNWNDLALLRVELRNSTKNAWKEIEDRIAPPIRKYDVQNQITPMKVPAKPVPVRAATPTPAPAPAPAPVKRVTIAARPPVSELVETKK
jgi:recombination protein RecA